MGTRHRDWRGAALGALLVSASVAGGATDAAAQSASTTPWDAYVDALTFGGFDPLAMPGLSDPLAPAPLSFSPEGLDLEAPVGSLAVSPTGDATYTMALALPPGRHGLAPSLALSYSSAAGDGPVGPRWLL